MGMTTETEEKRYRSVGEKLNRRCHMGGNSKEVRIHPTNISPASLCSTCELIGSNLNQCTETSQR